MKKLGSALFTLCAALVLFAGAHVFAAGTTANLSWTAPTSYSDGTALPASDIASYTLAWTATSPFAKAGTVSAASSALTATVSTLTCGTYNFTITVTTTATAYSPNSSATSAPVLYNTGVTCSAPVPSTSTFKLTIS